MEKLLTILQSMPEYKALLDGLTQNQSAAVTGIGQINRSHLIAGLHTTLTRPIVVICQDDMAAKRLQEELRAFLGKTFPLLPSRRISSCTLACTAFRPSARYFFGS